jgi:hypothetical protein
MAVGHALLAAGMSIYVLIAMRYEERDLEVTLAEPTAAGVSGRSRPECSPRWNPHCCVLVPLDRRDSSKEDAPWTLPRFVSI